MSSSEEEIVEEAALEGRDGKTRAIIIALSVLALVLGITTFVAVLIAWNLKERQVDAGKSVIAQVLSECESGEIESSLCDKASDAEKVVKEGPAGPPGLPGAEGPKGDKGDKGDTGATGPRGAKGDKGDTGDEGTPGDEGDDGTNGTDGANGTDGTDGSPGATGPKGDKGDKGDTGEAGPAGPEGPAGQSAFPFTFVITIPDNNPVNEDPKYRIYCETPDTDCTVTEVQEET